MNGLGIVGGKLSDEIRNENSRGDETKNEKGNKKEEFLFYF